MRGPTRTLVDAVGWRRTLALGLDVALKRGGRPFAHLPPPEDRRERLSRAQAEPAVLLYRALLRRYARGRALEVVSEVVTAGAVQHLEKTLGDLDPAEFRRMDQASRLKRVEAWTDRFFTATTRVDDVGPDRVSFTVTACALVRLSREAGHPELAPAFCRGDARFFASRTPPVHLERPTTLAEGGECCPFHLTLSAPDEEVRSGK
ncbi:MAG: L-2-amino-thiazoline-4-carboxylic acid hydrolase [Myxococcota bacterium]